MSAHQLRLWDPPPTDAIDVAPALRALAHVEVLPVAPPVAVEERRGLHPGWRAWCDDPTWAELVARYGPPRSS